MRRLREAFNDVIAELEYRGFYTPVFPIKVNQQRRVVEEVMSVNDRAPGRSVGLEAGSKPELLAVLALMRAGDTFRFWIPGKLAYDGLPGGDTPKGNLVFDITLHAVVQEP